MFFSFVIDAYSRRVVGWQFASHMRTTLVLDALRMALHQRQPGAEVALIQHTDAGSQYTSYDYTQTLDDHGVLASIGTVGDALDNAVAESFVDSFKTELITDRTWATRSQLELAVVEYVAWFNNERLHEALNDRPPREVEECERPANHPHQIKIGNLQTPPPSDPARLMLWAVPNNNDVGRLGALSLKGLEIVRVKGVLDAAALVYAPEEHGLLLPAAFYRARNGVAHQVCVNLHPSRGRRSWSALGPTGEHEVLRRGHTTGGPKGGPRRRFRLVQPIQQTRKRLSHAVSQHGPARTRTWDQSIMSRLL